MNGHNRIFSMFLMAAEKVLGFSVLVEIQTLERPVFEIVSPPESNKSLPIV